jgi:hypothetical protein
MTQTRITPGERQGCLPSAEARLPRRINRGFAEPWWHRYHELIKKRERCILKPAEHRELMK